MVCLGTIGADSGLIGGAWGCNVGCNWGLDGGARELILFIFNILQIALPLQPSADHALIKYLCLLHGSTIRSTIRATPFSHKYLSMLVATCQIKTTLAKYGWKLTPPVKWQRPPPRESNCSRNIGSLLLLLTTHVHISGSTNAVPLQTVPAALKPCMLAHSKSYDGAEHVAIRIFSFGQPV